MRGNKGPGFGTHIFALCRDQPKQSPNLVQRKAKLPRPANEPQSGDSSLS